MKVLFLSADSNGGYPIPAAKGGAVSTLVEYLADVNNKKQLCDMIVVSYYDPKAVELSKKYKNITFKWIKVPRLIKLLDMCIFNIIKTVKKSAKLISFKSPFSLIFYIYKAKRIVNKTTAEKVVIENNIPLIWIMKNTMYKGEWYYHLHNIPRIDAGCRSVINRTTKFICVSNFVLEQICNDKSAIGKIPKNKATVLHNCIDIKHFRPITKSDSNITTLKTEYGFNEGDYILIFTGRLSPEKGADILLKAMEKLPQNIKAMVVGSFMHNTNFMTDYQKVLYDLAKKLDKRVVFTGYVKQSDLPYFYNMADIAVLPSMWDEPAGLTNIEAMACGVPVITTDSGGIPEYVGASVIVERDEYIIENIAYNVMELIRNKDRYMSLKSYGLRFIRDNFDKEYYIDKFLRAIE